MIDKARDAERGMERTREGLERPARASHLPSLCCGLEAGGGGLAAVTFVQGSRREEGSGMATVEGHLSRAPNRRPWGTGWETGQHLSVHSKESVPGFLFLMRHPRGSCAGMEQAFLPLGPLPKLKASG